MKSFEGYMMRYRRGPRSADLARQHSSRVRRMLNFLHPHLSMEQLKDMEAVESLGTRWLPNFRAQPGTKKAYINSFEQFVNFLEHRDLGGFTEQHFRRLRQESKAWKASLRGEHQQRKAELMAQEEMELISDQEIAKFRKSPEISSIWGTVRSFQAKSARNIRSLALVDEQTYADIINLLAVEILIDNAQRTGALINMTMEEYKGRRNRIIKVGRHKTIVTSGPARFVLLPETERLMDVFVNKFRACLPLQKEFFRDDSRPVFCDHKGKEIGHLANRIQGLWYKAGMKSRISPTKLRKSAVTQVRHFSGTLVRPTHTP